MTINRTFTESLRHYGLLDDPKPTPRTTPVSSAAPTDAPRYLMKALADEAEKVRTATQGQRNHTLNIAAFSLGQLVAGAGLDPELVRDELTAAAHTAGLDPVETQRTITSGLTGGSKEPRGIPELRTVEIPPISAFYDDTTTPDPDSIRAFVEEHLPALDWHALWADDSEEEWIVEPLLPARRLVALYSAPKVGKSLLMLEIAVAVATGRPVLGVTPDRPRRVLYVDFENDPRADIRERLQAMQVKPGDLDQLHYLSFPSLAALDSDRGGQQLLAAIAHYQAEVVVVDTVSRAIAGEENENDTWLGFYRHTGLRLKKAGIALVRLDHSGKDETRGQRGGSAKSGDVDAVWRLSKVTEGTYRLDCEAARMPVTEKTLVLHRHDYPLRHQVDALGRAGAHRAETEAAVRALDSLELPDNTGRDKAVTALKNAGIHVKKRPLEEALRARKQRLGYLVQEDS